MTTELDKQIITNLFNQECKLQWRLISCNNFSQLTSPYWKILYGIYKEEPQQIDTILMSHQSLQDRLSQGGKTKMWKLVQEIYSKIPEQFLEFYKLNYFKDIKSERFHIVWHQIMDSLLSAEQQHVWNVETSQNKIYWWSLNKKFWEYIWMYFPYYQQVGVTIKQ